MNERMRIMAGWMLFVLGAALPGGYAHAQGTPAATVTASAARALPVTSADDPAVPAAGASDAATLLGDYRISDGDVIAITVLHADAFNRKLRVDSTGNVSLPLLGNIRVAGLTPREVETVVADILGTKFMNDPQVSVFVEESASLRFSIEGAVRTPNVYPLKGRVTLLQALAMGGGFTKVADQSQVRVIRGAGAEQQTLVFDAERIREGTLADPVIRGNDAIIAVSSTGKTVFYETLDTIRGIVSFGAVH